MVNHFFKPKKLNSSRVQALLNFQMANWFAAKKSLFCCSCVRLRLTDGGKKANGLGSQIYNLFQTLLLI